MTSLWLQAIWKILVKLDHFPTKSGWKFKKKNWVATTETMSCGLVSETSWCFGDSKARCTYRPGRWLWPKLLEWKMCEKSMGNLPKNGGVNPKMLGETPTTMAFPTKNDQHLGCQNGGSTVPPFKETLIFGSKGMGFLDVFSAEKNASKDHELKKNRRFIPQMKPKGPAAMENRPGHECFRASRVSHLESNTRPLSAQQKSHTWRAIRPVQWRNFTMISRLFVP